MVRWFRWWAKLWVLQKYLACPWHMGCMLSEYSVMTPTGLLSVTTASASVTVQMASRQYNLAGPQIKRGVRNSRASRNWPQANGESSHSRVDFTKMKVPVPLCCRAALSRHDCKTQPLKSPVAMVYYASYYTAQVKAGRATQGDGWTLCQLCSTGMAKGLLLTEAGGVVQVASLRRYIQAHDIQEVDPQSPKDELVAAVSRHWYNSVRISSRLGYPAMIL